MLASENLPFPIFSLLLLIGISVLVIIITGEIFAPGLITEGFEVIPQASFWSTFVSPRGDIGPNKEDPGYIRDPRYFNDYTDVTRIGVPYDFCRVIAPVENPTNFFFACALAGTDGTSSVSFRTANVKDGFKTSYDDYMNDTNGDGRNDYCRILKWKDGTWQPQCLRSGDTGFDTRNVVDSAPPANIKTLLSFYQDCVMWLRFDRNLSDTVGSVKVQTSGGLAIDERPNTSLEGVEFNGIDQFLRISDSNDLSLGFNVPLRSLRSWMVWVKFDKFTNNAKIFDFGNDKQDNVFLGILGKGDPAISQMEEAEIVQESTIPNKPSGAQAVMEMSPRRLMETTSANVDEWTCNGFELEPKKISRPPISGKIQVKYASLLYEVWDKQARKMSIKVNNIIPLGKWVHIAVVAQNNDAFRPDISIYVNGIQTLTKKSGFLPSASNMTSCYIGKSNWANNVSKYENRDELFKGRMFDLRAYQASVSKGLVESSYIWGKEKLGIE